MDVGLAVEIAFTAASLCAGVALWMSPDFEPTAKNWRSRHRFRRSILNKHTCEKPSLRDRRAITRWSRNYGRRLKPCSWSCGSGKNSQVAAKDKKAELAYETLVANAEEKASENSMSDWDLRSFRSIWINLLPPPAVIALARLLSESPLGFFFQAFFI